MTGDVKRKRSNNNDLSFAPQRGCKKTWRRCRIVQITHWYCHWLSTSGKLTIAGAGIPSMHVDSLPIYTEGCSSAGTQCDSQKDITGDITTENFHLVCMNHITFRGMRKWPQIPLVALKEGG